MRLHARQPVWDAAYERERDAQLASRVRWGVGLCLAALVFAMVDVRIDDSADTQGRIRFLYLLGAVTTLIGACTLSATGRRHSRTVALAFALSVIVVLVWYAWIIPHGTAVAAAALTALAMGCVILFPWGVRCQFLVAAVATLAFAALVVLDSAPPASALLSVVISTAGVSTVGAAMLDRYRRTSFARAWQQDRLVALGRDLQQTKPPDEVAGTIATHALEYLPAAVITVAIRDVDDDVYRVVAVTGGLADDFQHLRGFELPGDSPLLVEICARPHLLMPADAPGTKLAEYFVDRPDVRSLYVALRHGTEIEGVVGWTRRGEDFAPAEAEIARHFVTHAALGLRTARAVAELRQMNRLKSEFVSTVSHELRTPLNVILGYAEMARDAALAPADRDMCLDRIEAAGRELLDLIESTLEVGRLEAAQSPVRLETVKLAEFWAELGALCDKTPRAPGVRLAWLPAEAVTVTTDPHKLSVITRNLVGNACKFTTQGEVRAQLRLERETLVLDVIDTGIGIAPTDRQVIFDLFRQGDSSDSRRFGGTGLGLYIVERFCTQLGGTIDLDSQPGAGAHFTVRVPVARGRAILDAA